MKRCGLLALLACALPVASGCYQMEIDATALEPNVYLNTGDATNPEVAGEFEAEVIGSWLLWGLVDLKEPEIEDTLRREIERAGGSAVTGLEITTRTTFMNGFLAVITFGIYGQRTAVLTGRVVR
jgi:hypothetical protein